MLSGIQFDSYSIRARLMPALIVALPLGLSLLGWVPALTIGANALLGVATTCATAILIQVGRDFGKRKEPTLFEVWGGAPATTLLRHSSPSLNPVIRRQYHKRLAQFLPDGELPDAVREAASPKEADQAYEACIHRLRGSTRDKAKFPLVAHENVNYGFRRNLYGMKRLGVWLAGSGILISTAGLCFASGSSEAFRVIQGGSVVSNSILLTFWLTMVNSEWVRLAATAYAERLLEACLHLSDEPTNSEE